MEAPTCQVTRFDGHLEIIKWAPPGLLAGSMYLLDFVLRLVVMVMSFLAAIVMGVSQQTETLRWYSMLLAREYLHDYTLKSTGPGMSQLKFFVAANTIVCAHAAASLALSLAIKGPLAKMVTVAITMVDVLMVGLLSSSIGSGSAMAVILRKGSGHLYIKVCDIFGRTCRQADAAIVMSSLAAAALVALLLLSIFRLQRTVG